MSNLVFDDRGKVEYRGYEIDRVDPLDADYLGEDACQIRKIEADSGYWVEIRNEHGCGAVPFPTVAMAVQLIDYWVELNDAIEAALDASNIT